jgi:tryptophanyl-tRNA synthetase
VSRLERNPTVKAEIAEKGFERSVPAGFLCYPISQAADILFCKADVVPVGVDQLPMIEQTREIARSFNNYYGNGSDIFNEPDALIPINDIEQRLPGITGNDSKMSKSLGNAIYLADDETTLRAKIRQMYTDPSHLRVEDPGKLEGNTVFTYLDAFGTDLAEIERLKEHYQLGGLGDAKVKDYLFEVMNDHFGPIRDRRAELAKDPGYVMQVLAEGTAKANLVAESTLAEVRAAMMIDYFA